MTPTPDPVEALMAKARECAHPQANAANWHGLESAVRDALAAPPTAPPALDAQGEPAPQNSLPSWGDCQIRVSNSDFIAKRQADGGYGDEGDSPTAAELHRFIYEYDDADPYRSAWFMHRLERLINEVSAPAVVAVPVDLPIYAKRVRELADKLGDYLKLREEETDAREIANALDHMIDAAPEPPEAPSEGPTTGGRWIPTTWTQPNFNGAKKIDVRFRGNKATPCYDSDPEGWRWSDSGAASDIAYWRPSIAKDDDPPAEPASEPAGLTDEESAIDAYLADYSFESDEGSHTPGDFERFVIKDAIMGLLVDPDFIAAHEARKV